MPATSKRVSLFTESVIRRMTRVANRFGAINLSQGFPDFDPPPEVCRALARAAREGPHQYAITWGAADFRKGLADKHRRFSGAEIDPEGEIVVTCGSTEAMMAAMLAVCDPGDRVVVFSPFYENYAADAILSGAEPLHVMLRPPAFTFDPAELRAAFEQGRPKALVLCNPANPSGRVFTLDECRVIAELAQEFDAFVITDEVYEHIVYPPHRHVYISTLPGMRERTLVCNSLSKTYSITGWRLGYVIGPPAVMDGVRKVHDFLTVGAAAPLQAAALAGLALPDSYYAADGRRLPGPPRPLPGRARRRRAAVLHARGGLLRAVRRFALRRHRRHRFLRVAGRARRGGRRPGFVLLPRAGQPPDPLPLRQARRNPAGRTRTPAPPPRHRSRPDWLTGRNMMVYCQQYENDNRYTRCLAD